jgi:phosphatidylglycerol:prolipoprotein diacylglycerol transferase
VAVALFAGLVLAGAGAGRLGLRVDDLLFVVLGIVPGAVVGGRIGYVLLHPAFFAADPTRILDPASGSLELTLGVVGGTITGILVALLLDGRPGPWLHLGAAPMLLTLGIGKLATVLGGTGQGLPTAGEPATAYLGPGPWGSLAPDIPSIPSQALEGLATLLVLGLVLALATLPVFRRADGRLHLVALAAWAVVRAIVSSTWRDPVAIGPFRTEAVIAITVAIFAIVFAVVLIAVNGAGSEDELPDADGGAGGVRSVEEPLGRT